MNDKEAVEMMTRAAEEIGVLRGQIERMRPKAEAYDLLSAVVGLLPKSTRGEGEDFAWLLRKRIAEIESKVAAASMPRPVDDVGGGA